MRHKEGLGPKFCQAGARGVACGYHTNNESEKAGSRLLPLGSEVKVLQQVSLQLCI